MGAWKFEILVEDSDSGGPSLVDVRTEYLFAYDFDIENFVWKTYEGEKGIIILLTFSCGGAFNVSGWRVGAVGFTITCSMDLQSTCTPHLQYLQLEAHLEPSRTSAVKVFVEIVKVLKLLANFAEKLHFYNDIWLNSKCDLAQYLLYPEKGHKRSFLPLELHKGILDSLCFLILVIYTNK